MKRGGLRKYGGAVLSLLIGVQAGLPAIAYGEGAETLTGVVRNGNGDGVAGVTVRLHTLYGTESVVTDTYGAYAFDEVYESEGDVQVAAPGYRAYGARGVPFGNGAVHDIPLAPYSGVLPGEWKAASQTSQHLVLLASDGTVWTAGENTSGQLGDGTTIDRDTLMQVPGLTGVVQVATGEDFTLALKSDGSVWAWGENGDGQLGDGTTTDRWRPVPLALTSIDSIAAGKYHSLAADGYSAYSWGRDDRGQLGRYSVDEDERFSPAIIPGLAGVTSVVAGDNHSAALAGGWAYTWGDNSAGQLGTGSIGSYSSSPTQLTGLGGAVTKIAPADDSMLAFAGGQVWGWGYGEDGQLGPDGYDSDGNYLHTGTPAPVAIGAAGVLGDVVMLAGGDHHSVSLSVTGDVYAWGGGNDGQLGNGTPWGSDVPTQVSGLDGVISVSTTERTTFALRADGSFWYWGEGTYLGGSGLPSDRNRPYLIPPRSELQTVTMATLSGTVTDEVYGQGVAGAKVLASWSVWDEYEYDYVKKSTEIAVTGPTGEYTAVLPPHDEYEISIDADGFADAVFTDVGLVSGEQLVLHAVLGIGKPAILLNGAPTDVVLAGETYDDQGVTASDEEDNVIYDSEDVLVSGSVNTAVPGVYVLTYSVTDSDGNTGSATRTVIVVPADGGTAVRNATFLDVDPNVTRVGGSLRWQANPSEASGATFTLLWADADRKIVGPVGNRGWNSAESYAFSLPIGMSLPAGAAYLVVVAGPQGVAYVPVADATAPDQVMAGVRTALDRAGDGLRMDDVAAFLRTGADLTGDGLLNRSDISLILHSISSRALE